MQKLLEIVLSKEDILALLKVSGDIPVDYEPAEPDDSMDDQLWPVRITVKQAKRGPLETGL
jgi:hypothetical protein